MMEEDNYNCQDNSEDSCDCQDHWAEYVMRRLIVITAIVGAVALSITNHDGWGWLILLAFLLTT